MNFTKEQLLQGGEVPPRRQPEKNSSQYRGVTYDVSKAQWFAYQHLPKLARSKATDQKRFGSYASEVEAARARDRGVLHMVELVCLARTSFRSL
jgi:hypothetical protein